MKVTLSWEHGGIEILVDEKVIETIDYEDVLDCMDYHDIEEHFYDLHVDCPRVEDYPDVQEIVEQVRECLPHEDAFAYHVDQGHEGPLQWCEDLGCAVLSNMEDTLDDIIAHN